MSDLLLIVLFAAAATVSLLTSWVLVSRLERIGALLGLPEALLGVLAALAGDAPEITAAVAALVGHRAKIGVGVAIGSNVFNLAALLGLSAVLSDRIALHRRVILLEGTVAIALAATTVAVVAGGLPAAGGLALSAGVLLPYILLLGIPKNRLGKLGLPSSWSAWLSRAIHEEELELEEAIHPSPGGKLDALAAVVATLVVVGASVLMERAAAQLGTRHAIPQIITGALILAAVTSLPNAVAAIYLARRGRGAATLSTALNSNALNVVIGLMLASTIVGLGPPSGQSVLVSGWYLGLTVLALALAYRRSGLHRGQGMIIILGYLAFVGLLLATA